jgi:hypothetical protein
MNENETNSLEDQLHSWQPRRPSAGIRRRLFGSAPGRISRAAWILGSLAPPTACALLTLAFFDSGRNLSGVSSRPQPLLAMILSNQNYAVSQSARSQKGENNWSSITFDWTNGNNLTSSIVPFSR